MNKKYLYLGTVMALVAIFSAVTSFNFSSKENKGLVAEKVMEVSEANETPEKANKEHTDDGVMREAGTLLPRVAVNNEINYKPLSISDKEKKFTQENVAQLADILDISNPAERQILESIAQRQTANAKKLSDNRSSLVNEAREIVSLEIKEGRLSDENRARLETINTELLKAGEKFIENAIASEDEIRNLLDAGQQQNLMAYEKDKIVAFRSESISIILKSFLNRFEGELSTEQINFIDSIPATVANQVAIDDYNFGFSLSMSSDSIAKINTGSGFPAPLIDDAFMQLRNILTPEQIVQSKIDERRRLN